jgi:hypothetical protein
MSERGTIDGLLSPALAEIAGALLHRTLLPAYPVAAGG